MNAFSKLTILSSSLVLAFAVAACDDGNDDDGNNGGAGGNGTETGGSTSSGGRTGSGGNATGGLGGEGGGNGAQSILDIAKDDPNYSIFVAAVTKADLTTALSGDDLTVFLPTNDAFTDLLEELDLESLDDLTGDQLRPILLYHVVDSVLDSGELEDLAPGAAKSTSLGGTFEIEVDDGDLVIDDATVIEADLVATNGIVHVIDEVNLPSITDIVSTDARFTSLLELVVAADEGEGVPGISVTLDDDSPVGDWVLFAPENDAVDAVTTVPEDQDLTNFLLYHVVADATALTYTQALELDAEVIGTAYLTHSITVDGGTEVTIQDEDVDSDNVTVITGDIYAENGIIHVIDGVLLPD